MNKTIYDYAIIGAGPGGSFAAIELIKKGKSVILFEKEKQSSRKVCGDGLSKSCIQLLKNIQFPISRFELNGAASIEECISIDKNNFKYVEAYPKQERPYGLSRGITDKIFQDYAIEKGAKIVFETPVVTLNKENSLYNVQGFVFREYIIAGGVYAKDVHSGKYIHNVSALPIGISMVVEKQLPIRPFFLFDRFMEDLGGYGWIFKIDGDLWNVGLWVQKDVHRVKALFQHFVNTRVKEYLGDDYTIVSAPKGRALPTKLCDLHENCIGDARGTCSPDSGEGISRAIISAIEYVSKLS